MQRQCLNGCLASPKVHEPIGVMIKPADPFRFETGGGGQHWLAISQLDQADDTGAQVEFTANRVQSLRPQARVEGAIIDASD